MSDFKLTYNNKIVDIKLTSLVRFKLIAKGLHIGYGFIVDDTDEVAFCKTWSILLNVEFKDDVEAFLNGFNSLEAVNSYLLSVLDKDMLKDTSESTEAKDTEDKKKVS